MRLRARILSLVASGCLSVAAVGGGAAVVVAAGSGPAGAATTTVSIGSGFTFSPASVTIHVGDTVTWHHDSSSTMHSVTADNGSFDSSPSCPPTCLGANSSFSHTFNTAGTFRYYCRIHGAPGGVGMSGTVTVLALAPSTSVAGATTVPPSTGGTPSSAAPGGTAAPAAAPSASLPRTGSSSVPLLLAGAAAIVLGLAFMAGRRRIGHTRPTQ